MVGISDYGPVMVPTGAIELRIHGVSGTPADALLKAPPVLIAGTTTAGFYRTTPSSKPMTADSPGVREAYAWGGLTAGTRITSALRLLLLPFSLVNVAGWMLPGVSDETDGAPTRPKVSVGISRRAAAHALVSRLLALCLTAYATLGATWLATISIERVLGKYPVAILHDGQAQARVILLGVLLLIGIWVFVSRRQALAVAAPAPGAMARAPVTAPARSDFDVSMLWDGSNVARRLSGIHAAFAISSTALLTDAAMGQAGGIAAVTPAVAWTALALAALGLFAFAWNNPVGRALSAIVRVGAVPLALVAAALALLPREAALGSSAMVTNISEGLQVGMAFLAVAVFVLVLGQVFVGPTSGHLAGRLYASAFTVIGFGTAITAIAGLAEIITRLVADEDATDFIPGTAQTIAILGLVSCAVAAIVVLLRFNPAQEVTTVPWFKRLRDTTAHARTAIVTGACVFAVGANILAVTYFVNGRVLTPITSDEDAGWATWGWFVIAAVVAAIFAARLSSWALRIAVTLVGAIALTYTAWYAGAIAWMWVGDDSVAVAADKILLRSEQWFVVAAVTAALVTPMTAVIGYMWRGSKDQTTRRLVGVLWDLVTFWPRQFHPWAPPPYTDTTIPELAGRVQSLAETSGATSVTVSAHSQGAIIAVPALGRLKAQGFEPGKNGAAQVCLLTYGQLLDSHYRWLFPWIFNPYLFREIDEYLAGNWINLYRVTDPLGQPVPAIGAVDPTRDVEIADGLELDLGPTTRPKTLNHGDYWYSSAVYQAATDRLAGS